MNNFNLGWRKLNGPPSLWSRVKQDLSSMGKRPATTLDWVIFWISLAIGILVFIIQRS